MKYKYLIIAFTTTIVILTNLAYPTNATYAGDIPNEPQSSPKVAPIYKVRTALTVNPPSLDNLASNPQEFTVKNTHITNYSIKNLKSTNVSWWWGWCAKTQKVLDENWMNIILSFSINGKPQLIDNFLLKDSTMYIAIDGHGRQKTFCRTNIGLLTDWPAGDHILEIVARFQASINDGWDIYPANTIYQSNYEVNISHPSVISPVGAEYLGDTDYSCYDINGTNTFELSAQIHKFALENNGMMAGAKVIDSTEIGGICYADGTADLSDFNRTIKAHIKIPCWYPGPNVKQTEIDKFDNFMQKIAQHELHHVDLFEQNNDLYVNLVREANTCKQSTLSELRSLVNELEEQASDNFHNSLEGSPIPWPDK
jgi:hypothetical protein